MSKSFPYPKLLLLLGLLLVPAQPSSAGIFDKLFPGAPCKGVLEKWHEQGQLPEAARAVANEMAEAGVPMMMKTIGGRTIPVVLVNGATVERVKPLLDKSMGVMTQLQPDYNNDHGMMRVADKLMDVDTPGHRGYGEINDTGIAWKEIVGNTKRQQEGDSTRIEVNFLLSKTEMDIAEFYHRVRRAAIFKVPNTFTQGKFDPASPNAMQQGGEHCFVFCRGTAVASQVSGIDAKIRAAGIADPAKALDSPRVLDFLRAAKNDILSWKTTWGKGDLASYNNGAVNKMSQNGKPLLEAYADIFPAGLSPEKRTELANWFIAREAAASYSKLLVTLGVPGGTGYEGYGSPRASFIVIYDHNRESAANFNNGTFTADAKFGNGKWTATTQKAYQKQE